MTATEVNLQDSGSPGFVLETSDINRECLLNNLKGIGVSTLPTGANCELSLDLRGVQRVVLCDHEGLEGRPIHKQRNSGELHVEHIMMPLFVTHL